MKYFCLLLCCVALGCGAANVGVARGTVSSQEIDRYVAEHDVTQGEARAMLQAELDRQMVAEHAAKYGVSEEDAERQLEYAASREDRR